MLQALREFQVGRPQIFAGLMLLAFLIQGLWVAGSRKISDLEYQYIASGFPQNQGQDYRVTSPMTGFVAALPVRAVNWLKRVGPARLSAALAIPRPWLLRLPFVVFGTWLGGALWWVARRLFDNAGGYVAIALYCSSPGVAMISSNIGPEILLAWSSFGLIYTAIGVSHTLYTPWRKWIPRTVILGVSIGVALSTALWSFTLVLLALGLMLYLAPGRRKAVMAVIAGATIVGLAVVAFMVWLTGGGGLFTRSLITPGFSAKTGKAMLQGLAFPYADGYLAVTSYLFVLVFIVALTAYGSWKRARYFGNTAPLVTGFLVVLLFAWVPGLYLWQATLGLSFGFLFISGVAADLLETSLERVLTPLLFAGFALRVVLGVIALRFWIVANPR